MRVVDLWNSRSKPTLAFEFYPPKSEKGVQNLDQAIADLAPLGPDIFHVTFGAGGSTREGSYQLAERLIRDYRKPVIAYFAGFGLGPDDILRILDAYQSLGLENLLVVRGDPPKQEGFTPHPAGLRNTTDLLAFIRPRYRFCTGVAGYPEGHPQAPDLSFDLDILRRKVDAGAEYIIANYFYDNRFYFDFLDRCAAARITVPIIPGIMPIYNGKLMPIMARNCGASIPMDVRHAVEKFTDADAAALVAYGVARAVRQCDELLRHDIPGLLFYTMNRSVSSRAIVSRLRDASLL